MADSLKRLVLVSFAAALVASPAAGSYDYWTGAGNPCGCGFHAPVPPVHAYQRSTHVHEYAVQSQPSPVIEHAPARRTAPRSSRQYYSPEEAQVLYHPVVVPLDEFLRPGQPIALTPEQLARQRAAASARATPPPQITVPARTTPDADPFADDVTAEAAVTDKSVDTTAEDAFTEESMPAEQPETESTTEPDATPYSEPADAGEDPFDL